MAYAYPLTDANSVANYMQMSSAQRASALASLQTFIGYATDRMEQLTGRIFVARNFTERYSGAYMQDTLNLQHFPVITATRVAYGCEPALTISYAGSAIRAQIQAMDDRLQIDLYDVNGVDTQTVLLYSTYASTQALATAINALANGLTATVQANVLSTSLTPTPGTNVIAAPAVFSWPDKDYCEFTLNQQFGVIGQQSNRSGTFLGLNMYAGELSQAAFGQGQNYLSGGGIFPRGFDNIAVEYRAGWELSQLPLDLVQLCNEVVADMYNSGPKDWTLDSEKLDQYQYKLADRCKLNQDQLNRLYRWRVIPVGLGV